MGAFAAACTKPVSISSLVPGSSTALRSPPSSTDDTKFGIFGIVTFPRKRQSHRAHSRADSALIGPMQHRPTVRCTVYQRDYERWKRPRTQKNPNKQRSKLTGRSKLFLARSKLFLARSKLFWHVRHNVLFWRVRSNSNTTDRVY